MACCLRRVSIIFSRSAVLNGGNRLSTLMLQTGNFELRIHFESGGELKILTFFDLSIHGQGASRLSLFSMMAFMKLFCIISSATRA